MGLAALDKFLIKAMMRGEKGAVPLQDYFKNRVKKIIANRMAYLHGKPQGLDINSPIEKMLQGAEQKIMEGPTIYPSLNQMEVDPELFADASALYREAVKKAGR